MLVQIESIHLLYVVFIVSVLLILLLDLGIFQKKGSLPTIQKSLLQLSLWFAMAIVFGVVLWQIKGSAMGIQFLSGYLMEWSLSADNIFVFILILNFFKIPLHNHSRILFWGIIGAIIFRGIFIYAGSTLVSHFDWVLYIFGAILVYTGIKMLKQDGEQDDDFNPQDGWVYKFLIKRFNFSNDVQSSNFTVMENDKRLFTPLMLVVCLVAATDVMFAIDSIPAVFAISQSKLVIYSSNVFAVMGLRSMFFVLSGFIKKFHFLQYGISLVLVFIGAKMLTKIIGFEISSLISLGVIILLLFGSIFLSVLIKKEEKK